ncbi:hypothetical protein F5890DRAFT_346172 [Lentinula detonsa]|uniref:Uncharacterized protein n=1 Tax=Lentinula detonsa TaxID=2804962 RepID=A0AA38PVM6_9AGAR|nr:hypothetical protein F5890DRAFT_346172 [Lentinula detonsa]
MQITTTFRSISGKKSHKRMQENVFTTYALAAMLSPTRLLCLYFLSAVSLVAAMPRPLPNEQIGLVRCYCCCALCWCSYRHLFHRQSARALTVQIQARGASSSRVSSNPIILYLQTTTHNAEKLANPACSLKEVYQTPIGEYRRLFTTLADVLHENPGDYAVVEFHLLPVKDIRIVDVRSKGFWKGLGWPKILQDVRKGRLPGVFPGLKPDVYLAGSVALLYSDQAAVPPVLTYVAHGSGGTLKEAWTKLQEAGKEGTKQPKI